MATFAERLRLLRTERELTRLALSKLTGISHSSINMYERGEREPGLETLEIIADYFNVDMDYLLGRQDTLRRIDFSDLNLTAENTASPKIVSSFPERLKQCLEKNSSLSATILAEQIGLSKQAISMYLSGSRKPKRPTIKVIADALNVNEDWLIGYDVPMKKDVNHTNNPTLLFHQIENCFGKNCSDALQLYIKLDDIDKAKITERMSVLLEQEKYAVNTKNGASLA